MDAKVRYRKYHLEEEKYQELLLKQNGLCAICGDPPKKNKTGREPLLVIDHCHITGKVRGLLCHRCNTKVRHYEDAEFASKARKYLENAPDGLPILPFKKEDPNIYRVLGLRRLSKHLSRYGGIEGRFRMLSHYGYKRKEIAEDLQMSEPALDYWVRKWNKQ